MNLIHKKIKEMVKERDKAVSAENILLDKINSILMRKDMLEVNNDRVDTLRLLTYLLENNGKPSKLVKFLKAG